KLTGAKGAMELTCLPGIDIGGMFGRHYQWVTDYRRRGLFLTRRRKGAKERAFSHAKTQRRRCGPVCPPAYGGMPCRGESIHAAGRKAREVGLFLTRKRDHRSRTACRAATNTGARRAKSERPEQPGQRSS